jgi:hypothetical protein
LVIESLDIVAEVGFQVPLIKTVTAIVNGQGTIMITLVPTTSQEGPTISAIRISRVDDVVEDDGAVIARVNCGGPTIADGNGNTWTGDSLASLGYSAGGVTIEPSRWTTVNYATTPYTAALTVLLETERYVRPGSGNLEYVFAVNQPGVYLVKMLFVEAWHTQAGTRVFNVDIQGEPVFTNLDLVAQTGFQIPVLKESTVSIGATETELRVQFRPSDGSPEGPAVYGIELFRLADDVSRSRRSVTAELDQEDEFSLVTSTAANTQLVGLCAAAVLVGTIALVALRRRAAASAARSDKATDESTEPMRLQARKSNARGGSRMSGKMSSIPHLA